MQRAIKRIYSKIPLEGYFRVGKSAAREVNIGFYPSDRVVALGKYW